MTSDDAAEIARAISEALETPHSPVRPAQNGGFEFMCALKAQSGRVQRYRINVKYEGDLS
jgi:hypothetical protein